MYSSREELNHEEWNYSVEWESIKNRYKHIDRFVIWKIKSILFKLSNILFTLKMFAHTCQTVYKLVITNNYKLIITNNYKLLITN